MAKSHQGPARESTWGDILMDNFFLVPLAVLIGAGVVIPHLVDNIGGFGFFDAQGQGEIAVRVAASVVSGAAFLLAYATFVGSGDRRA